MRVTGIVGEGPVSEWWARQWGVKHFLGCILIERCFSRRVGEGVVKKLFFHATRRGLAEDAVMVRHCDGGD